MGVLSEKGRGKVRDWGDRGRNFSIFNCSEVDAEEIRELLSESISDLMTLDPSDLADLSQTSGPVLLYNITAEEAYDNAVSLHRLIVRLIRWEDQPVFLLSPDSKDKWERGNLWLGDGKIDGDGLHLDALTTILSQDSVISPSISLVDQVSDQPEMTYIEERMAKALEAQGISFKAQALIGRYHVDFLVEKSGAQVIVECDGRAYHSSDEAKVNDKKRDLYLQERGYTVLRFTGGEINGNISWCVKRIEQLLDKSWVEKSQRFKTEDNLDDSQQEAVSTSPGRVCVLAPAGSGKTKVLTNRGIHLVNEGFHEHQILALAFNKKAREEMQRRLRKMGFSEVKRRVHTFNSYGVQLLAHKPYSLSGYGFAKHEDDNRYIKTFFEVLQEHFVDEHKRKKKFNTYAKEAIRKTKGQLTSPSKFLQPMCQNYVQGKCPEEDDPRWSKIFERFLQWQKDSDHLTFADQVYLAVRELAEDPILRRKTQMSIDALLIDEFQDLDTAQSMLIEILALGHGNLFVVGDDDQMIYGWRGADLERLRSFLKDSETRKIVLSTNYRSSQLVVRHAGYLISHNENRETKNVRPKSKVFRGNVELFVGDDLAQESDYLLATLTSAQDGGFQWKDLAVLVRYKELYQSVTEALNLANIPFECEAWTNIYSRKAAKVILDYFTAVLEWPFLPGGAWINILTSPNIYLKNKYVAQVSSATAPISLLKSGQGLRSDQKEGVQHLLKNLDSLNKYEKDSQPNAYEIFEAIDSVFGLKDFFKQERSPSNDNDAADEGQVIDLLREKAKAFADPREFLKYCVEQKQQKQNENNGIELTDMQMKNSNDVVQVMTIHKAKGKEWPGVVLFHQEWRKPPSFETLDKEEKKKVEEEERRVVYVGATRAIESLWVTAERGKRSRFVEELFSDPEFKDLSVQREMQTRKTRLEALRHRIDHLQNEEREQQIKFDRGQGMEQAHIEREITIIEQRMGFIRRLLLRLGFVPSRLKQLQDDLEVVTEAVRAKQRMEEIEHEIDAKNATIEEIEEAIDRLDREEKFRRILSDLLEEDIEDQKPPF